MKGPTAGDVHAVYEVWAGVGLEVGCMYVSVCIVRTPRMRKLVPITGWP
jgi:hypothetical protein